jgi:hypothetical protein
MSEGVTDKERPHHSVVVNGKNGLRELSVYPTKKRARLLGEGTYGQVFAEQFLVRESGRRDSFQETFAVKHYTTDYQRDPTNAFEHYRLCLEADLPVPYTFGIEQGEQVTFATDLTKGGKFIVESYNSESAYDVANAHLIGVSNVEELVETFSSIALKAAYARIHLPMDSFFFIFQKYKKSQSVSVEVLLGDFDNIRPTPVKDIESIFTTNMTDIVQAFTRWLRRRAEEQGNDFNPEHIVQNMRGSEEFKRALQFPE